MISKLQLYSVGVSLALHMPFLYGFQASFFDASGSLPKEKYETKIVYQIEREVERKTVNKKIPAPREGRQALSREEAHQKHAVGAGEGKQVKEIVIPGRKKRFLEKVRRKRMIKRKLLMPTVENIKLEDARSKKIFFEYYDRIRKQIKDYTVYPYQAKVDIIEGDSYVSFVLRRSGRIQKIVLLESSGFSLLDDAAMNSIRNAEPFPPFPRELAGDNIKLNVPISFRLE